MRHLLLFSILATVADATSYQMLLLAAAAPFLTAAGPSQLLIGIDGKTFFEAAAVRNGPGGRDSVMVLDISDPAHPQVTAQLPKLVETIKVGRQPSGLSIGHDGRTALVANRAGKSVSLLRIDSTSVKQVGGRDAVDGLAGSKDERGGGDDDGAGDVLGYRRPRNISAAAPTMRPPQ